ncbi:MAG: nitroreductase/quinone reductase family protein [Acidimicrobiales bacterium]|nr:nitroreductase/quinone reductase family protein [Acidimicrobiales bacterium]
MSIDLPPGESPDQTVIMDWETPTHEQIVEITRAHVEAMESSTDPAIWVTVGMHHVLLYTVGRKSGNTHKVALPFWRDPNGDRLVIGSFAGAVKDPAWVLNLRDRTANPGVKVRTQHGAFWSEHQVLEGDERDEMWGLMTADRAFYSNYQAKTERTIPMIRLPETRSLDDEA